jgi:hypothetical protein
VPGATQVEHGSLGKRLLIGNVVGLSVTAATSHRTAAYSLYTGHDFSLELERIVTETFRIK